jgi:hypothetical protein
MKLETAKKIGEEMVDAVKEFVSKSLVPRDQRLDAQEKRLDALEAQQGKSLNLADAFKGGFAPNTDYKRGDLVLHRGCPWLCMAASSTREAPGSSTDWKLIMKSPR